MNPRLDEFRLNDQRQSIPPPRWWKLHALYESPLAIAAHLSPDPAQFSLDEASGTLLRWLSTIDQAARSVDIARPVVACLEVSEPARRGSMANWENDASWRGSGHVLYIEEPGKDAKDAERRLERLLFKTVDEALVNDDTLRVSAVDLLEGAIAESAPGRARSLLVGIQDLLRQREKSGALTDIEKRVGEFTRAWRGATKAQVDFGEAGPKRKATDAQENKLLPPRDSIKRLREVHLHNFRGWCGPDKHPVDVDADLVLFAGPNGHGKSTFMQAVMLALTGHAAHKHEDLRPRQPEHAQHGRNLRIVEAGTEVDVTLDLSVDPPQNGQEESSGNSIPFPELARSSLWHDLYRALGQTDAASRGEMDLSAVFSDKLHERFKDNVDNLVRVLSEGGVQLTAVRDALEAAKKDLDRDIQNQNARISNLRNEKKNADTRGDVLVAFEGARSIYQMFAGLHVHYQQGKALPSWEMLSGSEEERLKQVERVVNTLAGALGVDRDDLKDVVHRSIESWKDAEARNVAKDVRGKLEQHERERTDLERRYPGARERIEPFAADGDGPPLDVCLASLARNRGRWHQASIQDGLREVAEQLDRVIPEDLQRLSDLTSHHLEERRKAVNRIAWLDSEIERLRHQVEQTERGQQLTTVKDSEELKKLWRSLDERKRFEADEAEARRLEEERQEAEEDRRDLEAAIDRLTEVTLDPRLRKVFEDVLNDILGRIQLSPGLRPATVEASGKIVMKDLRTPDDLSTGQKTQLAVTLTVGINLALGDRIKTGVIAMDDVSAAYDISNIAREATFWRMVAYGHLARSGTPDKQSRQVFLSSHNEATTRRLIELLRPPGGGKMKVVRFTGWTPEHGPKYQIEDVRCAATSDPAARERLAREIKSTLSPRRSQ